MIEIKEIRNTIAGHLDKDFCLFYDTTLKLNGEKAANTFIAFIKVISQLQEFLTDLVVFANTIVREESKQLDTSIGCLKYKIEKIFSKNGSLNTKNNNL